MEVISNRKLSREESTWNVMYFGIAFQAVFVGRYTNAVCSRSAGLLWVCPVRGSTHCVHGVVSAHSSRDLPCLGSSVLATLLDRGAKNPTALMHTMPAAVSTHACIASIY